MCLPLSLCLPAYLSHIECVGVGIAPIVNMEIAVLGIQDRDATPALEKRDKRNGTALDRTGQDRMEHLLYLGALPVRSSLT
jgi:hypothetical protein